MTRIRNPAIDDRADCERGRTGIARHPFHGHDGQSYVPLAAEWVDGNGGFQEIGLVALDNDEW